MFCMKCGGDESECGSFQTCPCGSTMCSMCFDESALHLGHWKKSVEALVNQLTEDWKEEYE